jgi:hypothetical protein
MALLLPLAAIRLMIPFRADAANALEHFEIRFNEPDGFFTVSLPSLSHALL